MREKGLAPFPLNLGEIRFAFHHFTRDKDIVAHLLNQRRHFLSTRFCEFRNERLNLTDSVGLSALHCLVDTLNQFSVCRLLGSGLGGLALVLFSEQFKFVQEEFLVFLVRVSENAVEIVTFRHFFHSLITFTFLYKYYHGFEDKSSIFFFSGRFFSVPFPYLTNTLYRVACTKNTPTLCEKIHKRRFSTTKLLGEKNWQKIVTLFSWQMLTGVLY